MPPSSGKLGLLGSEDEGIIAFPNIRKYLPNNRASHPRRLEFSTSLFPRQRIQDSFIYDVYTSELFCH